MPVITVTEGDNGGIVEAHPGDEIVLRLPENPTTGYRWRVDRADDLVEPAADSDSYDAAPGATPGAGGVREFRFRGRAPGSGRLELTRSRPGDKEPQGAACFGVDVTIAA